MKRLAKGVRALGRHSAWVVAGAVLVWFAPVLFCRVFGTPDWYHPHDSVLLAGHLLVVSALSAAGLSTLVFSAPAKSSSRWLTVLVPPLVAMLVLAGLLVATGEVRSLRSLRRLDHPWALGTLALVFTMLLVIADTLQRPELSTRDLTLRVSVSTAVIWLFGVWTCSFPNFSWSCFSPIISAEYAARGATEGYPYRIACDLVATGCSVAVLLQRRRSPDRRGLFPLAGLTGWFASRTVVDLITFQVAMSVSDGRLEPAQANTLAVVASVVGVAGYSWAFGSWFIGAGSRVLASGRVPGGSPTLWPLLAALVLSTSSAFEPSISVQFPQQKPEAVWDEVSVEPITWTTEAGYIPFFMTRQDNVVTGVLSAGGELDLFHGGRRERFGYGDALDPPSDHFWNDGVELVVDEGATMGALRLAAQRLRHSAALSVVWRSNDLHEVSARGRERWDFVEMSARALRAQRIELSAQPEQCDEHISGSGPLAARRCGSRMLRGEQLDVHVIECSDDILVRDWLVANVPRFAGVQPTFVVSKEPLPFERFRSVGGSDRTEDPLTTRVGISDILSGLAAGSLMALVVLLVALRREFAELRKLLRHSVHVAPGTRVGVHHPSWVRPSLATSLVRGAKHGPYRAVAVMVADERTAWRELRRVARELATSVWRGAVRWVFVFVVACAVAFALGMIGS